MQHFDIRRNKRRYAPIPDLGTFRTRKTLSPRVPTRLVPRMRGSCLSRDTHGLPVPVDGCDCYLVNRGRVVPLPRGILATEKRGKASRTFVHIFASNGESVGSEVFLSREFIYFFVWQKIYALSGSCNIKIYVAFVDFMVKISCTKSRVCGCTEDGKGNFLPISLISFFNMILLFLRVRYT